MAGDPRSRKTAERINGDFLSWLDGRGDRPFFAFLNYYDAHAPFQPPMGDPRRYGLSTLPESERTEILRVKVDLIKGKPEMTSKPEAEKDAIVERAATLLRDSYDDCIASLDRQIGALFDDLEHRKVLDNTVVVLVADHGEEFGEHSLFGHGVSVYRPEVHVPLLIMPPKGPRAALVSAPVTLRDLPATLFDLIGAGESPFPGTSLARAWKSPDADGDFGPILSEVEHQRKFAPDPTIPASLGPISSILRGRYVYIKNADGREELYDQDADPDEVRNLAEGTGAQSLLMSLRASLGAILGEEEAPVPMTADSGADEDQVRGSRDMHIPEEVPLWECGGSPPLSSAGGPPRAAASRRTPKGGTASRNIKPLHSGRSCGFPRFPIGRASLRVRIIRLVCDGRAGTPVRLDRNRGRPNGSGEGSRRRCLAAQGSARSG